MDGPYIWDSDNLALADNGPTLFDTALQNFLKTSATKMNDPPLFTTASTASSTSASSPDDDNKVGTSSDVPIELSTATAASNGTSNKRKTSGTATSFKPPSTIKDLRKSAASSDRLSAEAPHHTHDTDLADEDSDDGDNEHKGNGGIRGGVTVKRREQNRNAQRAFRERKEKHLRELEDMVQSLQNTNTERETENEHLRDLVDQLRRENARLVETTDPVPNVNPAITSDFNFSVSPLRGTSAGGASVAPPILSVDSSTLPVSVNTSVPFNADAFLSLFGGNAIIPTLAASPVNSSSRGNSNSPADASKTPSSGVESLFNEPLFTPGGDHLNLLALSPPSSTNLESPSDLKPSSESAVSPKWTMWRASPPAGVSSASNEPALFSFNDLDNYFAREETMTSLDNDLFGAPAATAPSLASAPSVTSSGNSPFTPITPPLSDGMVNGCAFSKQARALGINSENGDFDIDQLCVDMKEKATCQEAARLALEKALSDGQSASHSSIFSVAKGYN